MLENLRDGASTAFLDGYIFRFLQEWLEQEGKDAGLYDYYADRVVNRRGGILDYEAALADYICTNLANKRILEVGTGIGTLVFLLAARGWCAAGIELDEGRLRVARGLRAAACAALPDIEQRYTLIEGQFPKDMDASWIGEDVAVVFTNVVAGWPSELISQISEILPKFGELIVELGWFGRNRNEEHERQALLEQLGRGSKAVEKLPMIGDRPYFVRISY